MHAVSVIGLGGMGQRMLGYPLQLDHAAKAFDAAAHSMPDFADALSVQILIEEILAS